MPIKVLAIDDDPGMTTLLKLFLDDNRFEVLAVNNSLESVQTTRRWKPDVIVLDLMMPSVSGWEICKQIRSFSQVPILVLTVITEQEKLLETLDYGATDYISKPVTKHELIASLIKLAGPISTDIRPGVH